MRISDVARAAGTTPRALRWYEKEGLLSPSRTSAGYREYDPGAVLRVRNIRELLALGFTIEDVRAFADLLDLRVPDRFAGPGGTGCAVALETARRRLAVLDERVAAVTRVRDLLAERLAEPGR
ncbi:MerR family transcriptional regulator [Sphaerisporangium corydalis]|uniref:MerR family transcriptional regulator n=1 Tax=Sphaerisporangium corydalis TaxID=1441875 RepID=A0ABV9EBE1_9ACTN|nr:MerR family transcriptional regulator [Sphaerisporangium corydalis]